MTKNNALKWLLGGFLGGFLLTGCVQKPLQYKPERIYHGPSLWCEMGEKGFHSQCIEPKEARK